jgi:hypothetical protein
MSKTQEKLEDASKAVTGACRSLVKQVQAIIENRNRDEGEDVDYSKLSGHDFKVRQMEQQVSTYNPPTPMAVCITAQFADESCVISRLKSCSLRTRSARPGISWAR